MVVVNHLHCCLEIVGSSLLKIIRKSYKNFMRNFFLDYFKFYSGLNFGHYKVVECMNSMVVLDCLLDFRMTGVNIDLLQMVLKDAQKKIKDMFPKIENSIDWITTERFTYHHVFYVLQQLQNPNIAEVLSISEMNAFFIENWKYKCHSESVWLLVSWYGISFR